MTAISDSFRWAGVELRHLVTFRTVADVGSLAGAARELGYSQPAVSQQLAALERIVGARLVERKAGGREVALTEAGRLALRHANAMLARAKAADADLRALEDGRAGTLRVGTIPSVGARLVPQLLSAFADDWPDIAVELTEHNDDAELLRGVEEGALDLAFALLPIDEGPFEHAEIIRDGYVLAVATSSPLAGAGCVSLEQLATLPLIVCSQSNAPEALLHAHGFAAQIRYRIESNETVAGLAAAGVGAALVPVLALDPVRPDLVRLELELQLPPRIIGIAWHRDRERARSARRFVDLARFAGADS